LWGRFEVEYLAALDDMSSHISFGLNELTGFSFCSGGWDSQTKNHLHCKVNRLPMPAEIFRSSFPPGRVIHCLASQDSEHWQLQTVAHGFACLRNTVS
jgi:hypothetical protein